MSEQQAEYKTEIEEALTVLGVGYDNDEPAVIIEKPRKDLALHEGGLSEYRVWGWVKKSAKFIFHVRRLRGAKLSIWEVVSLSIDENGECALSLGDLVKLTGYSRSEVSESVKELEEMGYLSVQKEAGKKSIFKPSFAARGENNPSDEPIQKTDGLTHPVSKDDYPSSLSNINLASSIKRVKRVNTHFQSGEQEQPDKVAEWLKMSQSPAVKRDIAIDDLLSKWAVAFVVKTTSKDWRNFAEYAVDQQIKDGWDPDKFIEWVKQQDGYPTFWTQRRMEENYPKAFIQDAPVQEPKYYTPPQGDFVPAPEKKP